MRPGDPLAPLVHGAAALGTLEAEEGVPTGGEVVVEEVVVEVGVVPEQDSLEALEGMWNRCWHVQKRNVHVL